MQYGSFLYHPAFASGKITQKFIKLYHDSIRTVIGTLKNSNINTMCKFIEVPDGEMLIDFNFYGVLYRLINHFKGIMLYSSISNIKKYY